MARGLSWIDVNQVDENEDSASTLAARPIDKGCRLCHSQYGHHEVTMAVLNVPGINTAQANAEYGSPALLLASANGHKAVVEALLAHPNIDINNQNKLGWSALFAASGNGHPETLSVLLNHPGIKANQLNTEGSTPWMLAAGNGHEAVVKIWLEVPGTDVNQMDMDGDSALIFAAMEGRTSCTRTTLTRNRSVSSSSTFPWFKS